MQTFADFLNAARRDHADHPHAVAAQLEGALPQVSCAEDVPPYASFVVHVFGEHLGEWERGATLLEAIGALPAAQGDEAARGAVRRGIAAFRSAGGAASALDGLAPPDVAQVMCVLCTICVARHETDRAIAALDGALQAAQRDGLPQGHAAIRALAVAGNNLAAELEERPQLDDAERAAMVRAAETGLAYWKRAGTWLEEERAEYQLARCLLRAGDVAGAREHIARCIAVCERNDAPAFERFFGRAVLAIVERASGNDEAFVEARQAALDEYGCIPQAERAWGKRELGEIAPDR